MKNWILFAVAVVVLTTTATVVVAFLPELESSTERTRPPVAAGTLVKRDGLQPKAIVDLPYTYEFGTLPQRTTGKHAWNVKNEGKAPLELWMIESTCSCTLAKFKDGSRAIVEPGQSEDIVLEFETRENNGSYTKGAKIGTNDPDLPSFDLQVHGMVYPAIQTFPPTGVVDFSTITNDTDDSSLPIAVFSKDRPDPEDPGAAKSSKPNDVTVKWSPLTKEELAGLKIDKGMAVMVNVKGNLPIGDFREEVVLTTDHPKQPEVKIGVSGKMTGSIMLSRERLIMHNVDAGTGGQDQVILTVRGNRETKFEVAKVPKEVKAEVLPADIAGKKGRYKLVSRLPRTVRITWSWPPVPASMLCIIRRSRESMIEPVILPETPIRPGRFGWSVVSTTSSRKSPMGRLPFTLTITAMPLSIFSPASSSLLRGDHFTVTSLGLDDLALRIFRSGRSLEKTAIGSVLSSVSLVMVEKSTTPVGGKVWIAG